MSKDNKWEIRGISADLRERVRSAVKTADVTYGVWISQALEAYFAKAEGDVLSAMASKLDHAVTRVRQATAALHTFDSRVEITVRRAVGEALAKWGLGSAPPSEGRGRGKA